MAIIAFRSKHSGKHVYDAARFLKFAVFSISAGILQVVTFTLLKELTALPYWPEYLIALVVSVIYNFTINRQLTFKSASNYALAMMKVCGYYVIFTPLSTWWGDQFTNAGINAYLVLLGTMVVNFITEFLFSRYVVYGKTVDTNARARQRAWTLEHTAAEPGPESY